MKTIENSFRFLLLLGMCLVGWGCVSTASENERPCPCAEGWTCCAENQKCVQDATRCPAGPIVTPPDATAPEAPRLETVVSGSPTAQVRVTVAGTAEAGARVRLFGDASCGGQPLGEGQADTAGGFRVEVPLASNDTTTLYGQAVDAAGNVSLCSAESLRVTHDDQTPLAPALSESVPASPSATQLNPVLSGTAEPGSLVRVYADADCQQALTFETQADAAGTFRLSVRVEPNTPTTFWARATDTAGNGSACSAMGLAYAHDDVPPLAPTQVETEPASPSATSLEPLWKGVTEPGTRVHLYAEADCLGVPLADVQADAEGRFEVRQTARANDSTSRWAQVTDVAGNASACVALGTYVHDDVAPAAPYLSLTTDPVSPSNRTDTPILQGSTEPGATVLIIVGSLAHNCATRQEYARGKAGADGSFRIPVKVPTTSSFTYFSARARVVDAAGNVSPCSANQAEYEYDITPPGPPSLAVLTQPSPSASATSLSLLVGIYPGDTLRAFLDSQCSGSVVGTVERWEDSIYGVIPLNVSPRSDNTLYLTATDKAGNTSACFSLGLRYQHAPDGPGWRGESHHNLSSASTVVDGAGHAFMVAGLHDTTPGSVMAWRSDDSGAWGSAYVLSSTADGYSAKVATNARGDAVAAWREADSSVRAARYTPATGWGTSVELLPAQRIVSTLTLTLGVDTEGNALAMWLEPWSTSDGTAHYAVVSRSAAAGADWGAEERPDIIHVRQPRLIATSRGGLLLSTHDPSSPAGYALHGRTYTHATGWSEGRLILPDMNPYIPVVVSEDEGGTVWLAAQRSRPDGFRDLWVQSLAPDGTAWSEPERVTPDTGLSDDVSVQLMGGRSDEVMVAWSDSTYDSTFLRAWTRYHPAGGTWGELRGLLDDTPHQNQAPLQNQAQLRLARGRDGEMYAAFVQQFGPKPAGQFAPNEWLRLRRFTPSGGWEPMAQTLASGNEYVRLEELLGNARGELLVLWRQYTSSCCGAPRVLRTRWLR